MNIKLSDEACSRWICEKLEPLASLPKPDEFVNRKDRRHGSDPEDAPKYWKMMQRFRSTFEYGWQPRDMVNDPAMMVMLMEKMPRPRVLRDDYGAWNCWTDGMSAKSARGIAPTIGRAVCEAFMLASGYKDQS